jgi:hypothetical protein
MTSRLLKVLRDLEITLCEETISFLCISKVMGS